MVATILAAALAIGTSDVQDYFPLAAGSVRTYEEEVVANGKKFTLSVVETVGSETALKRFEPYTDPDDKENPQKYRPVEGMGIEVLTSVDGRKGIPTYYEYRDNRVFIVGVETGVLMEKVYPIFAIGRNPEQWSYSGEIPVMGAPALATIEGETRVRKDYRFEGKDYPAVETTLHTHISFGGDLDADSVQRSVYAKGLGLVEFEEKGKQGSNTTTRKRKLVKVRNG
ncbi:MAG: hypothetical protein JNM28_04235 [Armatimonadetes bacterium]|nr:hypothetical protein [Armatimonadota bacterium]MBS1710286.1 hypothetical protein [Armatimonadota bacterium]MBX3109077.1 hypothetical protein [Fimbriimonadaceae bacterium]